MLFACKTELRDIKTLVTTPAPPSNHKKDTENCPLPRKQRQGYIFYPIRGQNGREKNQLLKKREKNQGWKRKKKDKKGRERENEGKKEEKEGKKKEKEWKKKEKEWKKKEKEG